MASIFASGVDAGMTTVARTPEAAAATASPCAWLPALAVMTPRARSLAVNAAMRFEAPRTLKEPARCRFSHLSQTPAAPVLRASVLNDTLQGMVMLIGTIVLLVGIVHAAGGLTHAVETLEAIDPKLVSPQGADDILSPTFMTSFWVLVCFGVIGLPHTAVRCISYKDSKAVHKGIIIGTIVVAVLMFGMHLAGALGRAVIPDLTVPDLVIPTLMVKVLPPFAAGIFLAAPMAAIMSTINAQLLQSSATIIKDLYLNLRPEQVENERRLKHMSAVITLVLGALLLLAAWRPPEMIIWLNLLAFGGLEAVFLWPLVLGLYWERANAAGALSAMIVGGVLYAVLATFKIQYLGFHPIVPSLLLSLLAFVVGNRFGQPGPQPAMISTDK